MWDRAGSTKCAKPFGNYRKMIKIPRAREAFFIYYSLAAGLAPAWLGVPPPPPAGCLAALLVIRNAALQLYCFPVVLGYQNIDILGGFGTMRT